MLASGEEASTSSNSSARASGFTFSHWRETANSALRSVGVRSIPSSRCPVRTWFAPNIRLANTQPRSTLSSICGAQSEMLVAPRGRRSSAAVTSAASREASSP